jgi:hypothetical protein
VSATRINRQDAGAAQRSCLLSKQAAPGRRGRRRRRGRRGRRHALPRVRAVQQRARAESAGAAGAQTGTRAPSGAGPLADGHAGDVVGREQRRAGRAGGQGHAYFRDEPIDRATGGIVVVVVVVEETLDARDDAGEAVLPCVLRCASTGDARGESTCVDLEVALAATIGPENGEKRRLGGVCGREERVRHLQCVHGALENRVQVAQLQGKSRAGRRRAPSTVRPARASS